jgi:hypothetical protein
MHRSTLFTLLFLTTACPQDDVASMSETGVDPTTTATDLPSESGTTQPSTGDGDGDTTAGDGDGTGDGDPGDGDGDGDTGSEAVPASLVVESNGQRIGYLMGVWDYGLFVWDDINELTFHINQVTGHVISGQPGIYHATPDCTGQRYATANVPIELCDAVGPAARRHVYGDGESNSGHTPAMALVATAGEPMLVDIQSLKSGLNCIAFAAQYCVLPIQVTNVIPTTFALPITVAESLAMP